MVIKQEKQKLCDELSRLDMTDVYMTFDGNNDQIQIGVLAANNPDVDLTFYRERIEGLALECLETIGNECNWKTDLGTDGEIIFDVPTKKITVTINGYEINKISERWSAKRCYDFVF